MSILDKLNELAKPLKRAILNSPLNDLLGQDMAVVILTDHKSGKALTLRANYFHHEEIIYLIGERDDLRWDNLVQGAPVIIRIKGNEYKGWAQVLEDRNIFMQALQQHPEILLNFSQKQNLTMDENKNILEEDLSNFFQRFLIIKGSITR